ncbi:CoA-binding protein [Streptococcus sp. DD12]|uniref:CoA-binding protein n=1 Tax=Streptococcus sp. DD12 TaxID=1777880 RepID=UPI00079C5443|nr:CoA-binding protein [Streptococcus sp. DD12]KXT75467.1 Succinyl-CoA synthetase, alpha subunit-related enzyme [Streptococcus sp. DD12]
MTDQFINAPHDVIFDMIRESRTIAVVGLSDREETASYRVAKFMQDQGFTIIPVNPRKAGQTILGQKVYARLQDIPVHINIVDVFRKSEALPEVARDFLETDADVFWAQLGLQSQEANQLLRKANRHRIVMNKCLKIVYQEMLDQGD